MIDIGVALVGLFSKLLLGLHDNYWAHKMKRLELEGSIEYEKFQLEKLKTEHGLELQKELIQSQNSAPPNGIIQAFTLLLRPLFSWAVLGLFTTFNVYLVYCFTHGIYVPEEMSKYFLFGKEYLLLSFSFWFGSKTFGEGVEISKTFKALKHRFTRKQ